MKPRHQSGLGAIAALVVLVLLALLAAAVVRLSWGGQSAIAQEVQAARAQAAMRAGIDWGLYQLLRGTWTACSTGFSQNLDLRTDTGMFVTVACTGASYNEGETSPGVAKSQTIFTLNVWACNGSTGSCPDNAAAAGPHYVERYRTLTVTP